MSARVGFDKWHFLLPVEEVSISPDFQATVRHTCNAGTGELLSTRELYSSGGTVIFGQQATFLTNNCQLAIKPDRLNGSSFCSVQFSAGAFAESNEHPLSWDESFDVARLVEAELLAAGAKVPLERAMVTRLDLAQNARLSQPVANYTPAFQSVTTRKKVNLMDFGDTGFLARNKSIQIGFYDKGAQMRQMDFPPLMCPVNTVRGEARFMKARGVQDAFGGKTLPELRRTRPDLKPVQRRILERDIFRPKMEAKFGASLNVEELMDFCSERSPSRPVQATERNFLAASLVESYGVEGALHLMIKKFHFDRNSESGQRQITRQRSKLQAMECALKQRKMTRDGSVVEELYKELKDAFLGD